MAQGDGLLTFLPNNIEYLKTTGLTGVNNGQITQIIDSVDNINKLALYYDDVLVTGPYIWYFKGIMPRHYTGNGILVNFNIVFTNIGTYLANPFFFTLSTGFDDLTTGNIDIPSWSSQTSQLEGLSNTITNLSINTISLYIQNTNLDSIVAGDLFRMYITIQNATNIFPIYAYIMSVDLEEWI